MTIRTFAVGDEAAQVSIYNEAGADLPRFKPATLDEVRRRCRASDFDPTTRFFALAAGTPVAYVSFQPNGRISYPWARKGYEPAAAPLFAHALQAMKARGLTRAVAAYRADWAPIHDFFTQQGFAQAREMVNYVLDLIDMPTPAARPSNSITPLTRDDLPALLQMGGSVLRCRTVAELEGHLLNNPYFPASSVFVLRSRADGAPMAVGVLVANATYAHPKQVDSAMPCFRLGAFGTEGMSTKRINGLFSFLAADRDVNVCGLDLMGYAAMKLEDTDVEMFAAQVPSDATHLARFFKSHFRRQGSFPVFEKDLQET